MKLAKKAGAKGILYQDRSKTPYATDYDKCPSVMLTKDDVEGIRQLIRYAKLILKLKTDCGYRYITLFFYSENPNPSTPIKAKICKSRMVENPKPFTVAEFSSRGPNPFINGILKVSKSL